jgi:threonine synthase
VADDYGIVIDTHTADGIKVAENLEPGVPMIVLETALAAKFNETILEALGGRRTSGRLREHRRPAAEVRRDAADVRP